MLGIDCTSKGSFRICKIAGGTIYIYIYIFPYGIYIYSYIGEGAVIKLHVCRFRLRQEPVPETNASLL